MEESPLPPRLAPDRWARICDGDDGRVNDQDDVDVEDFPLQGYEVSHADVKK